MISAMVRIVALLALAAALPVRAQSSERLAQVGAALIAGDSSRAYRIARDASRRDRQSAGLARARLRLEMSHHSEEWLPVFARHEQIADVARQLYRLSPNDTLALRALSVDALYTILTLHDKVMSIELVGGIRGYEDPEPYYGDAPGASYGRTTTDAIWAVMQDEARRMLPHSKFDLTSWSQIKYMLDATGRAESARTRLGAYLGRWKGAAPDDPRPHLVAAAVATLDEDWETLLVSARAMRTRQPDAPFPLLLLGLAHMRAGDTDAAEVAFEEGISRLPERLRYRFEDISALLTPDQQEAYARDPEGVAATFWAASDPRLFTTANERRVEHDARVVEADLLFSLNLYDFPALFDLPLWPPSGAETEQGRIWIRYGRPNATARFTTVTGEMAYGEQDTRFAVWEYPTFRYVFTDAWRRDSYQKYSPRASAFSGTETGTAINDDYVLQDRRLQREAPSLTQVTPSFPLSLLASRFRRPDGGTEAVVAYGVPLADPAVPPDELETGVFSVGPGGTVDARRATVRPNRGRVLTAEAASVWADAATVALPASSATVRAEVGAGTLWGAAGASLAPLPASGFGLSDILLASQVDEDGSGPVVRDGLAITPVPWGIFGVGDPIYVYVETYGLTLVDGRTSYSVEARLTPEATRGGILGALLGRGQGPGVAVRNDPQGDRATESTAFVIDASGQEPGRYTLRIEVTDRATGETAAMERTILLE